MSQSPTSSRSERLSFVAIGLEHKTAPLAVREELALEVEALERASLDLAADSAITEVSILSTCNRLEIYLVANEVDRAAEAARAWLTSNDAGLQPYVQRWDEPAVAEHLFRVAAGLESQVLGEPQVLSQVREMLARGQRLGTVGPILHTLFRSAISCARQARAGTALGKMDHTVGSEAVRAAEAALGSLAGRSVFLIGGGEISRLVAEELRHKGLGALYVANRTASVAVDLAERVGGRPVLLGDLPRLLPHVDVVFSATSARHYIVTLEDLPPSRTHPLHLFDLAIPRDVDPAAGALPYIVLHDLESLIPVGLETTWEGDIRKMESVIAAEVQEFMAWTLTRRVVPVIANLRSHVEAVQQQELKRIAPQLRDLTDRERAAVESLTGRLVDKMFHHLVTRLRLAAQTDPALIDAAEFFFLHGEGGLFAHAAESPGDAEGAPVSSESDAEL